jgi:hypothetical protein
MAQQPGRGKRVTKGDAAPKARARRPTPAATVITIRACDSGKLREEQVTRAAGLERLAREWRYVLRARSRWADNPGLRQVFGERARDDLVRAGISQTFIRHLATVKHVEVQLHDWNTADAEADRIHEAASAIPWEYLISAATSVEGRFQSFLITRLFRNKTPAVRTRQPQQILFVESAPGRLSETYEFDSERVRIRAAVRADGKQVDNMEILATPPLSKLKEKAWSQQWKALHVTGIDTQQATYLLKADDESAGKSDMWEKFTDSSDRVPDGMMLREHNISELPVDYRELAEKLVNPEKPPLVVTLNLYHSGARTARELVRRGAHSALGFLDEIEDEFAELFFQAFYSAWCAPGGLDIHDAFAKAWQAMSSDRLYGTGIVIWMGRSEPEKFPKSLRADAGLVTSKDERGARLERLGKMPINELLQVDFDIEDDVNYSLLHNDRQLLSKLTLTNLVKEPLEDITVQVELNVGAENYPYRRTLPVFDDVQLALASEVKIPLTATLPRSLRERVRSTVYVKVTCGGRTAYETTERVTLIPVDEWLDDTVNNPWLPSFVLPRDPAVLKIVASSRRYLIGIKDDPAAGFDGYQSVDNKAKNPTAGVDEQVQAIWTSLVNEYRLQYINPPPAYSEQTQRLRTPSEILASNSGTCIDLALLLASCLEYVDIYPVVVLLSGHAFVGYWRSEDAHDDFVDVARIPAAVPRVGSHEARQAAVPYVDQYGWRLTGLNYHEIMAYVTSGDLVMLEATFLTSASSFAEAMEEGRANMRSRLEFDSLLDIQLARSAAPPVTPLNVINA